MVPAVPNRPGEVLQARVLVTANGNQRFAIPVMLAVGGAASAPPLAATVTEVGVTGKPPVPVAVGWSPPPVGWGPGSDADAIPTVTAAAEAPLDAVAVATMLPGGRRDGPSMPAPLTVQAARALDVREAPLVRPARRRAAEVPDESPSETSHGLRLLTRLLPAVLLAFLLSGLVVRDMFVKGQPSVASDPILDDEPALLDDNPRIGLEFHERDERIFLAVGGRIKPGEGPEPGRPVPATWEASMRFGLVTLKEVDGKFLPDKRLTYKENGGSNNTCVRLDGDEWLFGERPWRKTDGSLVPDDPWPGRWKNRKVLLGKTRAGRERNGKQSVWVYDAEHVLVTQTVEIVPGGQSRLLDTCLVRYTIENQDSRPHKVGLRFLLDTYIGSNDGVPFLIPPARPGDRPRLCDTMLEFNRAEDVPDFIQALEKPETLSNPGIVAHVQFKMGGPIEPPSRVTLGAWPDPALSDRDPRCRQERTMWEVPVLPIRSLTPADSAVAIYWGDQVLQPGAKREVGFAYGLGTVSSGEGGGKLALTVAGSFKPRGEFTVTAYVQDPTPGQTVTLEVPKGFQVQGDEQQAVPPLAPDAGGRNSAVTWKVQAGGDAGQFPLTVRSSTGARQSRTVTITNRSGYLN
jgi:hypothetical protein